MTAPRPARLVGDILVPVSVGVAVSLALVTWAEPLVEAFDQKTAPLLSPGLVHTLPFGAVLAYLVLVHVVRPLYGKEGGGPELKGALVAWNLFLWVLSVMMLFGMCVPAYRRLRDSGWDVHESVCDPELSRWRGAQFFWVYVFALSKYAELVDTVFLVVRRKPVMLLHWYHHATVLLYTWYAVVTRYSPGYPFAIVNALVHSIMYMYYALRARDIRPPGAKYITQLQIAQMVLGIAVCGVFAYFHLVDPRPCVTDQPDAMLGAGVAMYASYLYLFAAFYVQRYNKRRRKTA